MLCGLLFGFDTILTEIKKREKITSANRLRDDNFCVKSSTPSFADQKSVQKSISSRNKEFKWERNLLSKNLDPALYRVGFDIMFKNIKVALLPLMRTNRKNDKKEKNKLKTQT